MGSQHKMSYRKIGKIGNGTYDLVYTCVSSNMALEIKGIIESLSTERAQVSLGFIMALQVSVQHALILKRLLAYLTHKA